MLIMLAVWLPLLALGEWGARAWAAAHGDALDVTRFVLQADADIGWRQRAGLDIVFLGNSLTTNEWGWRDRERPFDGAERTVLILGPSSTFGWGVTESETYARQLDGMLASERVINAGEIGYSVVQGARLFDAIRSSGARVGTVVIAYGVNDLDRHRFYYDSPRTDAEEFAMEHSPLSARITDILFSSALLHAGFKTMGMFAPHQRPMDISDDAVRVPPGDFRAHLVTLVGAAKEDGARVVLLTTAVLTPLNAAPEARAEMERIERGVTAYNGIVREVAASSDAGIVDIEAVFSGEARDALFVDPIHFSARGNELVARALASIIAGTSTIYAE